MDPFKFSQGSGSAMRVIIIVDSINWLPQLASAYYYGSARELTILTTRGQIPLTRCILHLNKKQ